MKSDARVRYTHMIINTSFVQLLKEKPLNKITVKAICEISNINRATFYNYYNDPYDLLEKIESELIYELQQLIAQSKHHDIVITIEDILIKIKENGELYSILFSNNGDSTFPTRIFSLCYEKISSNIDTLYPQISKTQQEWFYYFFAQGCSGIINQWVNNGMVETPREVAQFIEKINKSLLKTF